MPLAFLLLLFSGLAACAGKAPIPPPPQHFFNTEQGPDGETRFTFNYIQPEQERRSRRREPALLVEVPDSRDANAPVLPGQGPMIDQHQLYLDLEKALDERQLCLNGYRIDQRYPTRQGVSLRGRCR